MADYHSKVVLEDLNINKMKELPDSPPMVRDRYTESSWETLIRMVGYKVE